MHQFPHPLMVVSDLDGSLLDHHTYRWEDAIIWLDRLRAQGIPLVFCTSKTAAEVLPLQREMGLEGQPWIAENGAIAHMADDVGTQHRFPTPWHYPALCQWLANLRQHENYHFIGFHDATAQQIAEWTGLSLAQARLAMQREAAECVIWRDSEARLQQFQHQLQAQGLTLTEGGRFWHVMADSAGKGNALQWMLQTFKQVGKQWTTLGLGDGPNDIPMLEMTDYAVVIKGHSRHPVTLTRDDSARVYYAHARGPQGWSEGLAHFIS
ncbi:mannosyl-3-phosphoglycerate phosphatase-related protein [Enterobacterales bacterium CwR94]|nr:mannosyl-3-phosphoglycerate phosphatase-related protein [Enterobacterales bacterium CwR94]